MVKIGNGCYDQYKSNLHLKVLVTLLTNEMLELAFHPLFVGISTSIGLGPVSENWNCQVLSCCNSFLHVKKTQIYTNKLNWNMSVQFHSIF